MRLETWLRYVLSRHLIGFSLLMVCSLCVSCICKKSPAKVANRSRWKEKKNGRGKIVEKTLEPLPFRACLQGFRFYDYNSLLRKLDKSIVFGHSSPFCWISISLLLAMFCLPIPSSTLASCLFILFFAVLFRLCIVPRIVDRHSHSIKRRIVKRNQNLHGPELDETRG